MPHPASRLAASSAAKMPLIPIAQSSLTDTDSVDIRPEGGFDGIKNEYGRPGTGRPLARLA
ncbi:hypothetical protein MNKW57_15860 [Biformimicrobium ophioploci]|uniref:Uncharacterized protein n=1 Tax=Biformimicrobium ophioploci TaxID=3036711 RepID=A0ABQ6LYU7_9GAMM|nr:hypothetical protein MNKW57_15860 [Microbulbifer sp. NKW57]